MKYILFLLSIGTLLACHHATAESETNTDETVVENEEQSTPDYAVAIKFINDYVDAINKGDVNVDLDQWLDSRSDVTKAFKNSLRTMLEDAYREDPEMGLGFDPILDAQDLPSAFETEREDGEYLIVRGTDWPDFLLTLKLAQEDGKWLVDGSGVVNIPASQQSKR